MKKTVVIVVPIYEKLSERDQISLDFLRNNIKEHDKLIVCPINFDISKINTTGFKVKRLSPSRFKTKKTGLAMLMSKRFYSYFKDYDYMLYHKLGCIVFGNDKDLDKWASEDLSYIGAPWFRKNSENRRSIPGGVGVGSLSLRKISDFINLFKKRSISLTPNNYQSRKFFSEWRYWSRLKKFGSWIHLQQMIKQNKSAAHHLVRKFDKSEDMFWSFFAVQIDNNFKVASFDHGYKFAIEETPYGVLASSLPFGITDIACYNNQKWNQIISSRMPTKSIEEKVITKKSVSKTKTVGKKSTTAKKTTKKTSIKKK
jgi:hypothetical protein